MPSAPAIIRGSGSGDEGLPSYVVKSLSRDRVGCLTGRVVVYRRVGAENQRIDPAWLYAMPDAFGGIPCVSAESAVVNGILEITGHYDGAPQGDGVSASFESPEFTTFEIEITMNEQPIGTHPNFEALKAIYGWDPVEGAFVPYAPDAATLAGGFGANAPSSLKPSPLYKVDSFLVPGAVFRKNYIRRDVPRGIFDDIGMALKKPTGLEKFPELVAILQNGKRDWLKLAPSLVKRGNVVQVGENWQLSGPGGHNKDVYNSNLLLNSTSGGGGGGLG